MTNQPYELPAVDDDQDQDFAFHPKNVYPTLLLLSLTVLFLTLTGAFIYTRVQSDLPPIKLPILFLVNTAILLLSSYTIILAKRAYLADDTQRYTNMLWYTLGLSLFFLVMQCLAWYMLFQKQIFITSDNSAGYLYVISGLHFVHVIGGIPFLVLSCLE